MGTAVQDFLDWVKTFLPDDKFCRFKELLTFPLETVDSTEAIFQELEKFRGAPDANNKIEFTNTTYEEDFSWYISNVLKDDDFWKREGMRALKTAINSFLVIDVPANQLGLRPEPYYFIVEIDTVYDAEINRKNGNVEYLVFWESDKHLIFIDDVAWRRFEKVETTDEWKMVMEAVHTGWAYTAPEGDNPEVWGQEPQWGIGYAPACSFYRTVINKKDNIFDKRGPLTSTLTKLDWLLFWKTSKKYLDLYGAWPIIVGYKETCEYKDENNNACASGFINYQEYVPHLANDPNFPGGYKNCQKRCPVCEKKGIIGPGSYWTVDPPQDSTDVDLMKNPVTIVEISNDKLEYGVSEIIRLENEIRLNTVGYLNSEPTKEAINEKQVKSQFESRQAILDSIREQFDANKKFAYDTVARIRYGNLFLRSEIFGGREYFLQSAEDIALQYKQAKDSGLPMYEIARIRESYSNTKFRNNTTQAQRALILSQLEPWPDLSLKDLKFLGLDQMDPRNFFLKVDFINFVARFEREQLSVIEFGSEIRFSEKIRIIHSKLLEYVSETIQAATAAASALPDRGGNGGGTTGSDQR